MAILRKNRKDTYTVIDNSVFFDYSLSFKAKGLLCQMLSLPDGWAFSVEGLSKFTSDGITVVRNALIELEEHDYLKRTQLRTPEGKMSGIEYVVSEKPMSEKPISENPISDNPTLLNTNKLNTNKLNTKELNTKSNNKRFVPPTIEEVREYIRERNSSVDAEAFIDYYASQKWKKANGRPVEDWKACVRTWERNGYDDRRGNATREGVRGSTGKGDSTMGKCETPSWFKPIPSADTL